MSRDHHPPTAAEADVDKRHLAGPFDIIGDVHGCRDELIELLGRIGYRVELGKRADGRPVGVTAPLGRTVVFVGDLVDRGPETPDVLRIVMAMQAAGVALAVIGNHDAKFRRWLGGADVRVSHGLEQSIDQMGREDRDFHESVARFLDGLPIYLRLADDRLVVAHAGIQAEMIGGTTPAIRRFCIFGDTDGKSDANGLAIRYNWARRYDGAAHVVYGHTPVETATALNGTLCIDTGCCFGGRLTAYRWPERQIVTIEARHRYAARGRPFGLPPDRP